MSDNIFSVGDVLVSTWGFEQCNVDFFQVTKVTPKTLLMREIDHKTVEKKGMAGKAIPKVGKFIDDKELKRIILPPTYACVNGKIPGHTIARKWDGKPVYESWCH